MSRALVDRVLAAHASRDLAGLADCYAADATVWPTGWSEPVPAAAWVAAVPSILESFPDLDFEPGRLVVDGATAMIELRMTGTNLGPLHLNDTDRLVLQTSAESLPASGRVLTADGVVVFTVGGDRILAERHYWLFDRSLAQLGHLGDPKSRPEDVLEPR